MTPSVNFFVDVKGSQNVESNKKLNPEIQENECLSVSECV